ncbi:tetratricopeptide repeat protein [Gimesia aquarii]|uniref:Tetratricopeptide repeat protein n=1 Tax=Gimesia aquarii TaxID=2527964 RepID=A0A517W296_9PLAN|nr:PLDc N-terminal domain-containing protein [Gimesia aquarii]QDT99356.1 tetratricopeptide repeat protein [Gimesia aquarii]
MFAQEEPSVPPSNPYLNDSYSYGAPSPVMGFVWDAFWFLYFIFMIWMLVDCVRKDPDRFLWFWVILVFQPFGAFIYFFIRWLPTNQFQLPEFARPLFHQRRINELETAALQIGNAYQFVRWGDALKEAGIQQKSLDAYLQALNKEPDNLQALWGVAQIEMQLKKYESAKTRCHLILEADPEYKFGDVSLLYCKTICQLDTPDKAREHLIKHTKRWRQPEAMFMLATLEAEAGDHQAARKTLQGMLLDINGSPRGIARKFVRWKSKARRLLKHLPKS